ncbi:DNA-processing protein DprA [Haloplasma contractile]|uniref:DNA protecting protein DprA n=1 Tax=Haloplasma contractile SSD-17B TaxID=1033810 RepID=U2EFV1_9MOLU|nr:DNA-processing protein DprA [Haloplasma contractile]ERJ13501.1 DNA protecting protein DprA [Haloplasma contractile SSD-17B]
MTTRDILINLSTLALEVPTLYKYYSAIEKGIPIDAVLSEKHFKTYQALKEVPIEHNLQKQNIKIITIEDKLYPEPLRHIFRPPIVLYYMGDLNLLNKPIIAIIGSRNYSLYGKKVTEHLTKELIKNKIVVISGLAYGIDTIAHRTAINNLGKTISVIGSGFFHIYPKGHEKIAKEIAERHLLISEYPPHEAPVRSHFVFRNRLISALSSGVLVVEAKMKSGTMITVDYALNQGKQIYAIPSNLFEENGKGTNELIKEGAKVVTNIYDILEDFS